MTSQLLDDSDYWLLMEKHENSSEQLYFVKRAKHTVGPMAKIYYIPRK